MSKFLSEDFRKATIGKDKLSEVNTTLSLNQQSSFDICWRKKLERSKKLAYLYYKHKLQYSQEIYLNYVNNPTTRRIMIQFRLSEHDLMVEKLRKYHPPIPQNQRFCPFCIDKNEIEDETHFFLKCPKFDVVRSPFITAISQSVPNFSSLNDENRLIYLLSQQNEDIVNLTADYITNITKIRNAHMHK